MVLSLLSPQFPLIALSRGGLHQGTREPLLNCLRAGTHLPDKPWCFAWGLLLACLSLAPVLMWLKEQYRLQPPSLPVLSMAHRDPCLVSRTACPGLCLPQLLPKNQRQLVNFSEWSQCLGSICLSVWQIHVEGDRRERREDLKAACWLSPG